MWYLLKNNNMLVNLEYINKLDLANELELQSMPMALERTIALREVGRVLIKHFNDSALKLCECSKWYAPTLGEIIINYFPTWKDEQQNYKFNKRAQIFVSMLHGRLGTESKFKDIQKLTCLADYQLPRVLRKTGVLKYSSRLESIVDSEILIQAGSDHEFNIRRSTIEAATIPCDELKRYGIMASPIQIDYTLWKYAKSAKKPHHLTVTMVY